MESEHGFSTIQCAADIQRCEIAHRSLRESAWRRVAVSVCVQRHEYALSPLCRHYRHLTRLPVALHVPNESLGAKAIDEGSECHSGIRRSTGTSLADDSRCQLSRLRSRRNIGQSE